MFELSLRRRQHEAHGKVEDASVLLEVVKESFYAFMNDEIYGSRFSGKWIPSTFTVLSEPFSEQNRMLNSTIKMVRYRITEHYAELIESIYSQPGGRYDNETNIALLRGMFGLES